MKKFTISCLIFLCLSFNIIGVNTLAVTPSNVLKQGVYTLSDLNVSTDNLYDITNISQNEDAYILIFNENFVIMQSLRLSPSIKSFNLVPLKPNYQLVVLGKSEVYINPRSVK
ncbi:hypothetical protein [Clostridium cibarium]|jgi:hypothetical protein|uniref:Uncharacterized protein n=1 Tax=Clostridium cibarium TaxID=2762247 RepID=A0ABR8PZ84_9CLOT|nr:hypothetical protein [Clostridium cibarium]MBD7913473.1 hypothetical protein [Clostridium cibarium]